MNPGKPQREVYVEPLELPEPLRKMPEATPDRKTVEQPAEEPVHDGQ